MTFFVFFTNFSKKRLYLKNIVVLIRHARIVVQPGRTLRSGRRGRWFKSSQSDQLEKIKSDTEKYPLFLYPFIAQEQPLFYPVRF